MGNNERSQFWDTAAGLGDGVDTYSALQWRDMARALWITDQQANEGVLAGIGSQLAASGSASPVSIASGAAIVQGIYYQNTAPVSISIPIPTGGTTKHRIVLRAAWSSTQAARLALVSSNDGVNTYPVLTQQDNATWEIPLAGVTIDTDGVVTLEDQRDYAHFSLPFLFRRQGGSISNWSTTGTTTYKLPQTKIQSGVALVDWEDDDADSETKTVTFPKAYPSGYNPLVFVTLLQNGVANASRCKAAVYEVSTSSFKIRGYRTDDVDFPADTSIPVMWVAIGRR
jgi:hypothetical protein